MTVTIQISNSDNKLTQGEWAQFITEMRRTIQENCDKVLFIGGSDTFAPWQNARWVVAVSDENLMQLRSMIVGVRKACHQDAVALTCGTTELV
ncbi:MAG: hypothetical protein WKF77_19245 [Planctomycetaceae bacterium]